MEHYVEIKVEPPDSEDLQENNEPQPEMHPSEQVHIKSEPVVYPDVKIEIKQEPLDDSKDCVVPTDHLPETLMVKLEPTYYSSDSDHELQYYKAAPQAPPRSKRKSDSDDEYLPPKRKKKKDPKVKPSYRGKSRKQVNMVYSEEVTSRIEIVTINEEERQKEVGAALNLRKHMPHTCEWCAVGFVLEEAYIMHMNTHHSPEFTHECSLCRARLKTESQLYRHRLRHYRRYRCMVCRLVLKDKDTAASHVMAEHKHQAFACNFCGKTFKRPRYLERHIEQHHTKLLQLECPQCQRVFHERGRYRSHVRSHNEELRVTKAYHSVVVCAVCSKQYKNKSCLKRHLKTHVSTVCLLCCIPYGDEESLQLHYQHTHKTLYNSNTSGASCPHCGRACVTPALLKKHINRMHNDRIKKYQCDYCQRLYFTKGEVRSHILWSHERRGGHACAVPGCGRLFRSPARLRAHTRIDHLRLPTPRTHACSHCGKAFAKMNEENQVEDKLKRKRELTNARVKKYRNKKRTEFQQLNTSMQDDAAKEMQNKQIKENNAERKRALAKERSRRFREKKRLNVLKSVHHVVHDSQIPMPSHGNPPPLVLRNQRIVIHDSQSAGTATNMDVPLVKRESHRTTIHDSQIPGPSHENPPPLVLRNQRAIIHDSQIAGTSTNMDVPLLKRENHRTTTHDSQIPGPSHENPPPLVLRNQRTMIHDSQIAGTSTNMDVPLVKRENHRTTIHDSQIPGPSHENPPPLVLRNQGTIIHDSQIAGTSTNMDVPLVKGENHRTTIHDSQISGPSHENPPPLVLRNQRTIIHDSPIAGTSLNMDVPLVKRENGGTMIHGSPTAGTFANMSIPLVVRDDSGNSNRTRQNLLSPLKKENQPVHIDDNLVLLEDKVCASPTLNVQFNRSTASYSTYARDSSAHVQFHKQFTQNEFGYACRICDRLWFKGDLKNLTDDNVEFVRSFLPNIDEHSIAVCSTCRTSIQKKSIPKMAVYNGFDYPKIPDNLRNCPLDLVSERLISPRIPFMQIRRLRRVQGQYGIYGQVINVPAEVNTMVNKLPRNVNDDHCIYVHIKRKMIHKSSFLHGLINKHTIKEWLQYLVNTPLYLKYDITIDEQFFDNKQDVKLALGGSDENEEGNNSNDLEDIPIEESLLAQQQTVMWNDDLYLRIASGDNNLPTSLLFEEHAEELSFPSIYLGQFRQFREGIIITPFMMATSELRRSDRRGVTPHHLLYMAMKIMRMRVRDSLAVAVRNIGKKCNITKEEIQSEDYILNCMESNLAFLRSVPNSTWYWSERKKDIFAMIRQLGNPTVFFTISANEMGWLDLLQLLYKLRTHVLITKEEISQLHYMVKGTLVNEDAVTCAIYFNKLVNVVMNILQSKTCSPFRKYRVRHYFKRIEFQHRGSPRAHILAWLDNAPKNALNEDYDEAIELIDTLISISAAEASGNIKLQTHKHSFICYKGITAKKVKKCQFEAPFMPSKKTMILTPMKKTEKGFIHYQERYAEIRVRLENEDFENMDHFYNRNGINSDEDYYNIIRAGISRPKVFIKREPSEKWHNPFNPFILNIVQSNTDFQFIPEEYSCAAYVVEYVNKTSKGVSHLQRKIIETINEHPEFDIIDVTKNISVNILNHTEITSQEAAWYLLREPMSKASVVIVYIPTVWPIERQRIRKTMNKLSELDDDCTDVWKENWFDKYEKRPEHLESITLAQFVSKYTQNREQIYIVRHEPKIIRYRNYDMTIDINEYKREMVTLHLPFRNEEEEILAEMKFVTLYDDYEDIILQRRKEFESDIDIDKTIQICRELCREETPVDEDEIQDVVNRFPKENPV